MKSQAIAALLLIVMTGCTHVPSEPPAIKPWYPNANQNGDPIYGVFESRIPCSDCEKIKFALALYRDAKTGAPTTYKLARVYVAKSEGRSVVEGKWDITIGTLECHRSLIYELDENAPEEFRLYAAIDEDVLFILDDRRRPRRGTAGYGYALNRVD